MPADCEEAVAVPPRARSGPSAPSRTSNPYSEYPYVGWGWTPSMRTCRTVVRVKASSSTRPAAESEASCARTVAEPSANR